MELDLAEAVDLSQDMLLNERDTHTGALMAAITDSLTPELHKPYNRPTTYMHLLTY